MRLTGVVAKDAYEQPSNDTDGPGVRRLNLTLLATRLNDGPIQLGPVFVFWEAATTEEAEALLEIRTHDVVSIVVRRRFVQSVEYHLPNGRWEALPDGLSAAEDSELQSIADVMAAQQSRPVQEVFVYPGEIAPADFFYRRDKYARIQSPPPATEEQILEAESRLGVVLPLRLRKLYEYQNGDTVNQICVPEIEAEAITRAAEIGLEPFEHYSMLQPVTKLQTVHQFHSEFDENDWPDHWHDQRLTRMVLLARWYERKLFVDYSLPGDPRVGFGDFEGSDWDRTMRYWDTFDDFYGSLRLYEHLV